MFDSSAISRLPRVAVFLALSLATPASSITVTAASIFLAPLSFDAGGAATEAVVPADVNGDGRLDLIVAIQNDPGGAHLTNGLVAVLLGNGDGTYGAATTYDSGGSLPFSLALGDLNGDGHQDIVVANSCVFTGDTCSPGTLGVLRGRGDGTFDPAVGLPQIGSAPSSVKLADVNRDGATDIVLGVSTGSGPAAEILLGNGDGTFRSPVLAPTGGVEARSVAVGDVNGDGLVDLVVTGDSANGAGQSIATASVLLGNGDGTFRLAATYATAGSAGGFANAATLADFDLDGRLDLAVANYPDDRVGVLMGNGDGTFTPAAVYGSAAPLAWDLVAADVNGDGKPDVAIGNGSGVVGLLLGHGDGTFDPASSYSVPGVNTSIAAADLNGDGGVDVVVTNGNRSVSVLLNAAPCNAAAPVITVSADPSSLWPATGKPVNVTVHGTIVFGGCTQGASAVTYAVGDEYAVVAGSGPVAVAADGTFTFVVQLPASRRGDDADGRQYTISISAPGPSGAITARTTVIVPHDRGR